MRKIKKLITPIIMLGSICVLASCTNKGDDKKEPIEISSDIEANVVFWTNLYTDNDTAYMDGVIEDFNKVYPNINVTWEKSGKYAQIKAALDANITVKDKLPNMAVVYPDYIVDWIDDGLILDMSKYYDDENVGFGKTISPENEIVDDETTKKDDFIRDYLEENTQYSKKGTYTLPFLKTSEALFLNQSVFDAKGYKTPTTFRDLIDLSRQMIQDYPSLYNRRGVDTPLGFTSTSNLYITLSEMLNVPYASSTDANGDGKLSKSEAVLFNNDKAKKMVRMLKDLYDEKIFTTAELLTIEMNTGTEQYIESPFGGFNTTEKDGNPMFMVVDSTRGASYIAENETFYSSVHPLCSADDSILESADYSTGGDKGTVKAMSQGGSVTFFDKNDTDNLASWLFYKFLTNTDNTANFSNLQSCSPLRSSSFETDVIKNIVSHKNDVLEDTSSTKLETAVLTAELYDIYNSYADNGNYTMAPVNTFSSAARTAVQNVLKNVLSSNKTGSELDSLIASELQTAYDNI